MEIVIILERTNGNEIEMEFKQQPELRSKL